MHPDGDGSARSWLEMLVAGAALAELEQFRARLVDGVSPRRAAQVESEARLALHLHTLLAERKRHAAELTVLNDLARQLTSLRHPKEVLTEVALQTRRLIGVDVAYIMLAQDHDVLRIVVVDGSLGSALRGIELPRGVGLGGHVLETGDPYWSENYVNDETLRHRKTVDDAATHEKLGGILGVPMQVGDEAIGVLLAADRGPRTFGEHEIGLLMSLAAHAAVAIHNAELFDQYQRTAEELQRSSESIRQTVDLHERLTKIVLGGEGLGVVVDTLGAVLGADVIVLDAGDKIISSAPHEAALADAIPAPGSLLDGEPPSRHFKDPHARRTRLGRGTGGSWTIAPIVVAESYAGCLVALREREFDDSALRSLETGATVVGLVLASDRAVAEAERRAQGELVAALLGGHADEKTIRRRAAAAGVNLNSIRSVVVLLPGADDGGRATTTAIRLASGFNGWSADYDGHAVALLPIADLADVRSQLRALTDDHSATIGMAATAGTTDGVRIAYRKARDCTALLVALGRQGTSASADELGIYQFLFAQSGRHELRGFIDATIGSLLRYDEDHHSELAATLSTYLSQSSRHTAAAQALHIHVNTLYQRLRKISEIMGEVWREPDRAIEVQLALRLHALSENLSR